MKETCILKGFCSKSITRKTKENKSYQFFFFKHLRSYSHTRKKKHLRIKRNICAISFMFFNFAQEEQKKHASIRVLLNIKNHMLFKD